jgi:CheY-like chemotaxis protein
VVLMSGVVNKSVADKAVSVQADELIRKPFQPQELIGRVKSLLAPKEPVPAPRERQATSALQSLFAPPPTVFLPTTPIVPVAGIPQPPAVFFAAASTPEPVVADAPLPPLDMLAIDQVASPEEPAIELAATEPVAAEPTATEQPAPLPESRPDPAWPRALMEAFTPLLPPFSPEPAQPPVRSQAQQLLQTPAPPASQHIPAGSPDVAKLRGEITRLELLVKKLQTELQIEREYTQAVENQIHTLLTSD